MNIPDEAIEAALESLFGPDPKMRELKRTIWTPVITSILEGAAPFIAARALREVADGIRAVASLRTVERAGAMHDVAAWIHAHAHELESDS